MKQRLFEWLPTLFVLLFYAVFFGPLVFLASDEIYRTYTNPYERPTSPNQDQRYDR